MPRLPVLLGHPPLPAYGNRGTFSVGINEMSKQAKYTPIPWIYDREISEIVSDKRGKVYRTICQMGLRGLGVQTAQVDHANAEFIVRACNSHEKLVAALKQVEFIRDDAKTKVFYCPACYNTADEGHTFQCVIGDSLAESTGGK